MYYDYSYYYGGEDMLGLMLFYGIYLVTALGFGVALYVLRAIGVHAIAKNRELKHGWFAWIPVLDQYLLGCISDQYQYVVKGKHKNKRKILLILNLVYAGLFVALIASFVAMITQATMGYVSESRMIAMTMRMMTMFLPLFVIAIVMIVFRFMALYDLYVSCDPKNSTMYLILSILFQVTEPFFIFFNRKQDEGMPPRRVAEEPQWKEEPWVNE